MKNILLLLITFTFLTSCAETQKTNEEIIKENIEARLKSSMKDPASYEFVSMEIEATFSVGERRYILTEDVVNKFRESNKVVPAEEHLNQVEKEYEFLQKQTDESKEGIYFVGFVAKGTNSRGEVIQTYYYAKIINDENKTVLSLDKMD